MIVVERTGPSVLVQDLGRPGHAHLGVTASGAADRREFRLANRLLGNDDGAAAFEVVLGGLAVRTDRELWCAVTGPGVGISVLGTDSRLRHSYAPQLVRLGPGERLRLGVPLTGLRNYLAVRGGLSTEQTLGSRSSDVLSGLGPPPVRAGDRFLVGGPTTAPPSPVPPPPRALRRTLAVTAGPRRDWIGDEGWRRLLTGPWQVSQESNRVGVRLIGPAVGRRPGFEGLELASEGLIAGAVQLPPAGAPVIFGPDHPLTGGYPVVAVLARASLDDLGQLRAGDPIRFADADPGPRQAGVEGPGLARTADAGEDGGTVDRSLAGT